MIQTQTCLKVADNSGAKNQIESRERINKRKKRARKIVMLVPACVAVAMLAGGIVGTSGAIIYLISRAPLA